MVVYNKVIPNSALNTLLTLGLGVAALAVFDFMFKFVKTRLLDEVCENIDKNLSPKLYKKIISWDIQDTPKSVGQSAAPSS